MVVVTIENTGERRLRQAKEECSVFFNYVNGKVRFVGANFPVIALICSLLVYSDMPHLPLVLDSLHAGERKP